MLMFAAVMLREHCSVHVTNMYLISTIANTNKSSSAIQYGMHEMRKDESTWHDYFSFILIFFLTCNYTFHHGYQFSPAKLHRSYHHGLDKDAAISTHHYSRTLLLPSRTASRIRSLASSTPSLVPIISMASSLAWSRGTWILQLLSLRIELTLEPLGPITCR